MKPLAIAENVPPKDPQIVQLILDESNELVRISHVMIVETKHGFVCANAGIDRSNVEGENTVTLLPEYPDEEAKKITENLKDLVGKNIAVIISDSFGRPFRRGSVGVAIGLSGIEAVLDKRGTHDLYGKELRSTIVGQVDNLASAAQLVMGEADEGMPVIIIRGYSFEKGTKSSINQILREKESDLFRREYLSSTLKTRRSYKFNYSQRPLERTVLKECINIARWAPSAHNGQYWRYFIMDKNESRRKLIDDMKHSISLCGNDFTWKAIEKITVAKYRIEFRKYFLLAGGKIPEREVKL